MANVKRQVTESQKETVNSIPINNLGFVDDYEDEVPTIQVPSFLTKENEVPDEQQEHEMATLNNMPGNKRIEEINHLKELKNVCSNYTESEWEIILQFTPSYLMTTELQRRLTGHEEFRATMKKADSVMDKYNL